MFIYIIVFILFIIVSLFIYGFILNYISTKKHNEFKEKLEGKSLFFYTDKKDYIEINNFVIQNLDKNIIQIKLIQDKVLSIFDTDKIHRFINHEKLKEFPITINIINRKVEQKSFLKEYKLVTKQKLESITVLNEITNWYKK